MDKEKMEGRMDRRKKEKMKKKMQKKGMMRGQMKRKMDEESMDIVYEMETNKSLEEAIESLEVNLRENNFGVLWQLNFKDKFEEKGLEFDEDYVVLEVCNPKQAKEVLEINNHVGYVLPCKMVVRTDKGQTYIGMANPEALIGLFDEAALDKTAEKVKEALKKSIQASI